MNLNVLTSEGRYSSYLIKTKYVFTLEPIISLPKQADVWTRWKCSGVYGTLKYFWFSNLSQCYYNEYDCYNFHMNIYYQYTYEEDDKGMQSMFQLRSAKLMMVLFMSLAFIFLTGILMHPEKHKMGDQESDGQRVWEFGTKA